MPGFESFASFRDVSFVMYFICVCVVCSPLTVVVMPPEVEGDTLYRFCLLLISVPTPSGKSWIFFYKISRTWKVLEIIV